MGQKFSYLKIDCDNKTYHLRVDNECASKVQGILDSFFTTGILMGYKFKISKATWNQDCSESCRLHIVTIEAYQKNSSYSLFRFNLVNYYKEYSVFIEAPYLDVDLEESLRNNRVLDTYKRDFCKLNIEDKFAKLNQLFQIF